eukprot:5098060-Pleurochrysis_carterae.AAC.1
MYRYSLGMTLVGLQGHIEPLGSKEYSLGFLDSRCILRRRCKGDSTAYCTGDTASRPMPWATQRRVRPVRLWAETDRVG